MRRLLTAFIVVTVLGACRASPPAASHPAASPRAANLTIFAAASLKAAMGRAVTAYQVANPGTSITVSTDASSALEAQIELGAQADLFLSADTANPQRLVGAGLAGPMTAFATNRLTVIVPKGNPAAIRSPLDLIRPGVKVIAAGDAVPITRYANELVANLSQQPGYPTTFATTYQARIASQEDNVAAVVAKIELGEGDAAIVYATDAKASGKVDAVAVPDPANVVATYGGVVLQRSPNQAAAAAFLAWLAGPGGQAVLAGFGFLSTP
jgi:molybdate transport system substrate-binding protein